MAEMQQNKVATRFWPFNWKNLLKVTSHLTSHHQLAIVELASHCNQWIAVSSQTWQSRLKIARIWTIIHIIRGWSWGYLSVISSVWKGGIRRHWSFDEIKAWWLLALWHSVHSVRRLMHTFRLTPTSGSFNYYKYLKTRRQQLKRHNRDHVEYMLNLGICKTISTVCVLGIAMHCIVIAPIESPAASMVRWCQLSSESNLLNV